MKYKCCTPNCPGLAYKASVKRHPCRSIYAKAAIERGQSSDFDQATVGEIAAQNESRTDFGGDPYTN